MLLLNTATTTAAPLQPPQIVNPVLGGQDVRNVAANQMDIRNADPRDIRLSNGYKTISFKIITNEWQSTPALIVIYHLKINTVHTLTFQWRINVIQPETYFAKFPEMFVVIFAAFQVSLFNRMASFI